MEKGLQQISGLAHVGGSFVCDYAGEVILSSTPAVLATVTMNAIGREVSQAFAAIEAGSAAASRLDIAYDTWRLVATDIGNAILFVLSEPEVDLPILRMTVDIIAAGWKKDSNVQKQLARHRAPRRDVLAKGRFDDVSLRTLKIIQSGL